MSQRNQTERKAFAGAQMSAAINALARRDQAPAAAEGAAGILTLIAKQSMKRITPIALILFAPLARELDGGSEFRGEMAAAIAP